MHLHCWAVMHSLIGSHTASLQNKVTARQGPVLERSYWHREASTLPLTRDSRVAYGPWPVEDGAAPPSASMAELDQQGASPHAHVS
jgi:hypothetical protein